MRCRSANRWWDTGRFPFPCLRFAGHAGYHFDGVRWYDEDGLLVHVHDALEDVELGWPIAEAG
jgi:hypothetical protein